MEQDREGSIQARAYQLWEQGGRADGDHERHWRQAERDIDVAEPAGTAPSSSGDAPGTPADGGADASALRDGRPGKPRRVPAAIDEP